MSTSTVTSTPHFYDAAKCGTLFKPELEEAALEGIQFARDNGIPSSSEDKTRNVILSIIDNQVDFTNPTLGNLYVAGAEQDLDRLCQFIFGNVGRISHVLASLDTHYLYQPFHAYMWVAGANNTLSRKTGQPYQEGEHPDAFTLISMDDINSGVWRPCRLPQRMQQMIKKLEHDGKKTLCIWPLHCILGTPGHALDPALMETIFFHAAARKNQYDLTEKGMSQSAEHYGILQAEAQFSDDPQTQLNTRVLNKWEDADVIYFAGQAKSHCVLETLNQVVEIFLKTSPEVIKKIRVLSDCTSSIPDICDENGKVIVPFDDIAEARFTELEKLGVQFVNSTDPIPG